MKKLRKVSPQRRKKARKVAEENLDTRASLMMKHPKNCCLCDLPFERTAETVLTWRVTVNESRVRLTCPACSALVQKTIDHHNAD